VFGRDRSLTDMERPAPDPVKLLESWMEWERGEATPGRVMSSLKTGGLRVLLEAIVEQIPASAAPAAAEALVVEEAWTPVV
jgi:hypothetical protein